MQQLMQYMSPLAGRSDSNLEWQPPPTYEYLQSSLWWILLGKFWGGGVLVRDHRGQAIVALSMKQLFHGDLQGHQIAHINILKRFLLKMCTTKHHTPRTSVLQPHVHRFILLIYLLVFVLPYKSVKDFLCFHRRTSFQIQIYFYVT